MNASWTAGVQFSNLGSKVKYLNTKESLPAFVKAGGSVDLSFNQNHRLIVAADLGYRMIPSDVRSLGVSAGAEYTLVEHFKFRGGYHYGDKKKGDASYATAGLGVHYLGGKSRLFMVVCREEYSYEKLLLVIFRLHFLTEVIIYSTIKKSFYEKRFEKSQLSP